MAKRVSKYFGVALLAFTVTQIFSYWSLWYMGWYEYREFSITDDPFTLVFVMVGLIASCAVIILYMVVEEFLRFLDREEDNNADK